MNSNVPLRYKESFSGPDHIEYDQIVDTTDFKRSQETERNALLSGNTGGDLSSGLYDFDEEKVDMSRFPSSTILALRSGKVDKADVDTLLRNEDLKSQEEVKNNVSEKKAKELKEINEARQSYLDSKTGFDPKSVKE